MVEPKQRAGFMGRLVSMIAAAFLFASMFASPALADVRINRRPAMVVRKTFDPAHPPREMPALTGDEAALTQTKFECGIGITYQPLSHHQQGGQCESALKVRGVNVTLQLQIIIWLPQGATAKLKAHEEGHRQIAERVYEQAEQTAKSLATPVDGQTLSGTAASCAQAEKAAVKDATEQYCKSYLDEVGQPAARVNDLYDQITAHGLKAEPAEDEAIRQAFERDKASH